MTRAQGSRLRRGGFKAMLSPVPGNVFACMEELGIEDIRQVDDEISGKCPMHLERLGKPDRHASWSVNAEEGYFNCFSCGYKGPFVQLVKDVLKVDHADAVVWIRERGVIERAKRKLGRGQFIEDLAKGPVDTSEQINEASLALFTDPPPEALAEKNIALFAAMQYDIRWDPERRAWITPIREPSGKLMGWQEKNKRYFRNRPDDVKKSTTLFGIEIFLANQSMIIVESPLDTARILTAGIEGAVSTFGSGVSDAQLDLIFEYTDEPIFAFDADKAGDKASEYARRYCMRRGVRARFFDYSKVPVGVKDPGDMTDDEIHEALANSYSSVVARF